MVKQVEDKPTVPICKMASFVGTIFGVSKESVLEKLGVEIEVPNPCLNCGKSRGLNRKFCSKVCQVEYTRIDLQCDECGIWFKRIASLVVKYPCRKGKNHFFHSRQCFSIWFGRNYSFVAHPENIRLNLEGCPRKHDWEMVWAWHCLTGFGSRRLSRYLDIGEPSIENILFKKRKELAAKT